MAQHDDDEAAWLKTDNSILRRAANFANNVVQTEPISNYQIAYLRYNTTFDQMCQPRGFIMPKSTPKFDYELFVVTLIDLKSQLKNWRVTNKYYRSDLITDKGKKEASIEMFGIRFAQRKRYHSVGRPSVPAVKRGSPTPSTFDNCRMRTVIMVQSQYFLSRASK